VQVQADLSADEATQDKLEYAKRGTPLRQRTETEQLRGGGTGGGAAGTAGNIPSYAQGGGASSNYRRKSEEMDFGVDKTVTRTKIAPGKVNRLDVALVLDKSVPASDVAALRKAVEGAAGIDPKRGDKISVSQLAFAKPPAPKAAGPLPGGLGALKYVGLGIATLVFLFLVGEPVWLRELESPTTLAELEQSGGVAAPAPPRPQSRASQVHREVEDLVSREPDRVAQQVRAWMHES
jgi:flagellar M-ring protein FliF